LQLNDMNPILPFKAIRRLSVSQGLGSKLGSLLLLFQRSPLIQMLFPEARLLGGAGMGQITKWTVTTIAGLGAYDSVAGATEISQVSPQQGAAEVSARTGGFLNFVYQITGTPSNDAVSWSLDGLPPGLTDSDTSNPSVHVITGTPTEVGQTTVTVTAWEGPNQTGQSFSREFLIVVEPGLIVTHPASVTVPSGGSTTLSVVADPAGGTASYRWFRGTPPNGIQISGEAGSQSTFTTPGLTAATNYWVRVTQGGVTQNSNAATVSINTSPVITTQPASTTIASGTSASLSVATSSANASIQWYQGNSGDISNPIEGAIFPAFTTPALTTTTSYWARVTDAGGSSDSNTATVTVAIAPLITAQPVSTIINSGGTATLTVAASGTSPAFQWYIGQSGDNSNPVSGGSGTFTTPALTTTTSYWARATNVAGTADSNSATVTVTPPAVVGAGPFKLGESVTIDLTPLSNAGETLKLLGKLPKGLKLNLQTGSITGTVAASTGTYPIKFDLFQGKTLVRTIDFPIVIAGTLFFAGGYEALLESTGGVPAGTLKLSFKKGNAWSATLQSPGAKTRKSSGKIILAPGSTAGTLTATFAASGSAPALTVNANLDLESPLVSGTYNGGTIRGFRLAAGDELPATGTALNLVFEAGPHDGVAVPAGIGWATGSIGPAGSATFSGLLGDGTAVSLPVKLSATGQVILWSQPYGNPGSYFGGIITLPDLGQTTAGDPPLEENVWWFKGADTKSLSYPAGFPAMGVTVGSSTWTVPTTASALGASLGWANNDSPVVEIDGAGLSNAAPQPGTPTLPTGFTLDASFNLTTPVSPSVVPWTGKSSAANGTFTGSFTLPATFVPEGIAGPAAASGVLLQADPWGNVTGCGLIKVPVAGAKGSFRTAAIILKQ
jgi:hypothetical protein